MLLWPIRLTFRIAWGRALGGRRFGELAGKGIIEPATGRYMIDYGSYAELYEDGVRFGGRSGRALNTLTPWPPAPTDTEMLRLIRLLLGVVDVREEGEEVIHGVRCRRLAIRIDLEKASQAMTEPLPTPQVDRFELLRALPGTVWIDGTFVRRIEFAELGPRHLAVELWDFGLDTDEYDWARLPAFRSPSEAAHYSGAHQSSFRRAKRALRVRLRS